MTVAVGLAFALAAVDVFSYAYDRIGISSGWMLTALIGSLWGSRVDVPVIRVAAGRRPPQLVHTSSGAQWCEYPTEPVTIAVNVGGALIPGIVASYLIVQHHLLVPGTLAIAIVAGVVFASARIVPGTGILIPTLLPPLVAAVSALWIGGPMVAALAYVAGTLGTLIGADVLNLPNVRNLGSQRVSIGGGGTFDAVFLTGILAVVLATL